MKQILVFTAFLAVFALFFCKNESKPVLAPLVFSIQNQSWKSTADPKSTAKNLAAAEVKAAWPVASGGSKQATEGINGAVERWCAGALHVGEGPSSQRIAKEASAFIAAFREAQKANPTEFAWAAEIEGKAIFQSAKIASIELTSTNFTGGAHGGASSFLASFDLTNGHQLLKNEILSDTSAVLPMLAAAFAKQKSVADVREVIFPDLVFCLPANIAIVKEGVRFVYDPYEVAAWAVGGTDILLTWEQLGKAANPVWK